VLECRFVEQKCKETGMKTPIFIKASFGVAALILAGCGTPEKSADTRMVTGVTKPAAAAPTAETLLALERQANAAYLKGDSNALEGMLNDRFQMRNGGRQVDKAAVLKLAADNKCSVKDWRLEDPLIARIDADTYVLDYKGVFDGSCAGPGGEPMKIVSPIRAATVWTRSGDAWQAAFHGQDPILDPKNLPSPAPVAGKKNLTDEHKAVTNAKSTSDPNTAAMMAVEKSSWEAWMAKDAVKLQELTAPDLSFQNIFGIYFANKSDTIKIWTSTYCDIKSVGVTDGEGILLSPTVGLLNRTGTAEGTCNGQKLPLVPIYGTSVFVKQGDSWKLAFSLNRLD
jgi:hypothetical protein